MNVRLPSPARILSRTGWLVVLGLALRCYHYLRDPSMWHDEASLVVNVLDKDFLELLGPLKHSGNGPPLFLWMERLAVLLLGDSTYAMRFVPYVASCVSLLVIVAVARRLLQPAAVPWVALFFAFSDHLLWHACEAKPYMTDVLVATGFLAAFTFGRGWPLARQLGLATLAAPAGIALSFPACFLVGGLGLCLLPAVWRERRAAVWLLYGAFGAVAAITFLLLLVGPIRAQRSDGLLQCWVDVFPDWGRPWTVPGWLAQRLTEVARYANEPVGNVLCIATLVGAVALWRRGQRRLVAFLLLPIALTAVAALVKQYPLGAFRVMAFATPAVLLLTAAGMPPTLAWLRRFGPVGTAALVGVTLLPVSQAGYRAFVPWLRADAAGAAAYVRARWQPEEVVIGNAWEDFYYFRDYADAYQPRETLHRLDRDRVWLLASGGDADVRQTIFDSLQALGSWDVLDRREFTRVTVYHLERSGRVARAGPPAAQ